MIITRKDFAKRTELSYAMTCVIFDRFQLKSTDIRDKDRHYNVSWYNLNDIKEFLTKRRKLKNADKIFKNINEMMEE